METVKLGEHEITMYTDSKDMPHYVYARFNQMVMIDAGVGSSIEQVMSHCQSLYEFVANEKKEDAMKEAENLHYNFNMILLGINFSSLAFACRIHSIDGVKREDYTDNGLRETVRILDSIQLSQRQVEDFVSEIKKKISDEMKASYPDFFGEDETLTFYRNLKRMVLVMQGIIEHGETEELLNEKRQLDEYFYERRRPGIYRPNSSDNELLVFEKATENLYAMLEANGVQSPGKLTVFQFYARLDYMKKSSQSIKNIRQ